MFISLKKGLFDKEEEKELNNSFKLIEDKIESFNSTSIESTLKSADIEVTNAYNNYSKYYGNIIVILVRAEPTAELSIPKSLAPPYEMYTRAFTELDNDDKDKYFTAKLDTDGKITLEADTEYNVVFYFTYVLSKNPLL